MLASRSECSRQNHSCYQTGEAVPVQFACGHQRSLPRQKWVAPAEQHLRLIAVRYAICHQCRVQRTQTIDLAGQAMRVGLFLLSTPAQLRLSANGVSPAMSDVRPNSRRERRR